MSGLELFFVWAGYTQVPRGELGACFTHASLAYAPMRPFALQASQLR